MPKTAKKHQEPQAEQHTFDAEIARVLHLMIHALYTNRDIFLRELISNASDACDKLRYEATQNDGLLGDNPDLKIHLSFDAKAKTITIEDTGIGMNREDLIANLGTIAKSGTREFFEQIEKNKDTNLIGQFGVGFYSAFMVADKVSVTSCKAGEEDAWVWESQGLGNYTISIAPTRARGTTITLHLKDDAKEYLDKHKLGFITKTYSDHVSFPIMLTDEEGVTQPLNDGSAIWTRNKSDVSDEQYQEFYRHIAHSPEKPWMVLHNKVEGKVEYTNLLFIPGMKPFDLFHPDRKLRVKLYVKRVYITDEGVDLVPAYMRFLRGVIDSADLPLNISRETLQKNAVLTKIRESITSRVLADLKKRAEKEPEEYAKFWENFGPVLKEGLCEAIEPRDKILDACRFYSTHGEAMTSLTDYKSRMKPDQEAIYYITGDSLKALQSSPQIEGFKARGIEVLLLTDHVDDFWTNVTLKYDDTPFKSVLRAGKDFENKEEKAEEAATITSLMDAMKKLYGEQVRDVRTTTRLADSPVCLAIGEGDMGMRMERFLAEHNQLPKRMPKILEVNPNHPLIQKLAEVHDEDSLWLLLDQARIAEGEPVSDVAAFTNRLNAKMLLA